MDWTRECFTLDDDRALIRWCLTSLAKTGGSIEHFLLDLQDSIGIVAGDESTANTFEDKLHEARILQPGAVSKEEGAQLRTERSV